MSCSARRAADTVPQSVDGNWKGLQPAPAEQPSLPGVLADAQLSDRAAAVDVGDPPRGTSQDLSNMKLIPEDKAVSTGGSVAKELE
ncbi:UNVERIFIED_CONTAM: hypothetical protein FKN15_007833 [Acipenser sinensis]